MEVCTGEKRNESQQELDVIHVHEWEGRQWNGEFKYFGSTIQSNVESRRECSQGGLGGEEYQE